MDASRSSASPPLIFAPRKHIAPAQQPQWQVQQPHHQPQQQQKPLMIQCYQFDDDDKEVEDEYGEEDDDNDDEIDAAEESVLDRPIGQLLGDESLLGKGAAASLALQSAFALFFRDTLSQVKRDQPAASFGEASRAIRRLWDRLDQLGRAGYAKRSAALRSGQSYSLPVPVNLGRRHLDHQFYRAEHLEPPAAAAPTDPRRRKNGGPNQSSRHAAAMPVKSSGGSGKRRPKEKQPNPLQAKPAPAAEAASSDVPGVCARHGCAKPAIDHPQWDGEYCSTDCCLLHVGQVRLLFAGLSAAAAHVNSS